MIFDNNELLEVAYVVKPHGLNGFLSIKVVDEFSKSHFIKDMPVFLVTEGIPVPFFIEAIKQVGSTIALKFLLIDDSEKALRFKSCSIYMTPTKKLKEEREESSFDLLGYKVYDSKHGYIGIVSGLNQIPGNPVFETQLDEKTIIIPYIDEFIVNINNQEKILEVSTPDGLIDLYL